MTQESVTPIPPLLGNKQGQFKIHVIGNSGDQSTLSAQLSEILRIPIISLDRVYWKPNWVGTPEEEFRNSVREAMDRNGRGWIVDGDYSKILGTQVSEEATDIIWLDPPLLLYFPRLFLRSIARMFGLVAPCSPECLETVRECFFSRKSILLWCLTHHWVVRKSSEKLIKDYGIGVGRRSDEQKMRRMGGWGSELRTWFEDVWLVFGSR
ncbi:hypothetical protein F5887DRAFT_1137453 [Amanita rubescens]|nr:hypothetical protein F5887DRAFT_1137453 [Amanita rubescens]